MVGLLCFVILLRAAIAAPLTMAVAWSSSLSEPNKAQGSAAIALLRVCWRYATVQVNSVSGYALPCSVVSGGIVPGFKPILSPADSALREIV